MTPRRTALRLRVGAVALAALATTGSLALLAEPAAAQAPKAPVALSAVGHDKFVRVYWAPPTDDGGKPVTKYIISRFKVGQQLPEETWQRTTTAPLKDTTATAGTVYQYRITAVNADGNSPSGATGLAVMQADRSELWAFGGSAETFLNRQYGDFLGRKPTVAEHAVKLGLANGTTSTGSIIEKVLHDNGRVQLHQPLLRLYRAYFDRAPDKGGLEYWINRRTDGAILDVVSSKFAGSSEFKNTYGSLNNKQFVKLVYQNVLDRDPLVDDVEGYNYWVGQLAKGAKRGRVMTQFSESNEYKTTSRGVVEANDVWDEMMGTAMPENLAIVWGRHIQAGGNPGDFGTFLTLQDDY